MKKEEYINEIIKISNGLLIYKEFIDDLGGLIEELFWDIVIPESVKNKLSEEDERLDNIDDYLHKLSIVLRSCNLFKDLTNQIISVKFNLHNLRDNIDYISSMSSEDVLMICSIIDKVKILRDTLQYAENE